MKKFKGKKGFTLIEMTVCVLTLALVALICTTGYSIAMRSYNDSKFESNSQMLESMLNTSLGDVLRYAYDISDEGTAVVFSNDSYGLLGGGLTVKNDRLIYKDGDTENFLVSTYSYIDGLYIKDFDLNYTVNDEGKNIFEGSYTICSEFSTKEKVVTFRYISIIDTI